MAYAGIYDLGKHLLNQTDFETNDTNEIRWWLHCNSYVNNL